MKPGPFPHDLIQLQAAFNRTYDALATPHPAHTAHAELRRRLVVLSSRLWSHPFWSDPGRAPAARAQLRSHTRALHEDAQ
ncbi:hypothetical protein ACFYXC_41570 [Streptomyces sp. NPDC002701]|uniref:hypothetical protein n=1 Tax=Streptomyces sp. NPDC002701 TaxID=3364661 RepID=UPI00369D06E2